MRQELLNGLPLYGSWIQTGSPAAAEVLANAGFRWLAVDMEHTETSLKDFANIARAIAKYGTFPMVRTSENNTVEIRKYLDCGAKGVIVPMVNSAEEAKKAVSACKYPPEGVRGFAFVRANDWGDSFDTYVKSANSKTIVIVMVETKEAVENIDEILSVEGVDGVFIGPYDLSGSYGIPGQTDHKLVKDAMQTVLLACKRHKKAAGQHIVTPTKENVSEAVLSGFTFLALGMDTVFVSDGAKTALKMTDL